MAESFLDSVQRKGEQALGKLKDGRRRQGHKCSGRRRPEGTRRPSSGILSRTEEEEEEVRGARCTIESISMKAEKKKNLMLVAQFFSFYTEWK